jgi:hypothetical protein
MPVAQLERVVQQCLVTADTRRADPTPSVVSARIQHARSETNSGFWSALCAIGVRAQTRFSRRTRAASKLEDALGGLLRNGYIAGTFSR